MIFEDIDWQDGMLVSAAHFKNIKKVNFYNLFFLLKTRLKFFYGVIDIEFDHTQILNGIVKINKVICVMPEGSFVDFNVFNESNQTLYIDLKNKNIDNEQEKILCLAVFHNNYIDKESKLYNVNNVKYENENTSVLTEYINFNKIKPYLFILNECTANMTYIPLLKVKKAYNNYFLQNFLYLHFVITKNNEFGKQVLSFISELLSKIYLINNKIRELHREKYIDYELFNIIRAYDNICYVLYNLQQEIINQGVCMYSLYCKLSDLLRKSNCINYQNIQEINEFDIYNLYNLFTNLLDNIKSLVNNVFYADINIISMHKNDRDEFRALYNNAVIKDKIYIQCFYSNKFLNDKNEIYNVINNMSICSSSYVNYIHSTRITGLERKIKNNFVEIKDIISGINIDNSIIIEVDLVECNFFKYNEEIVIILPKDCNNKFSFNIVYPNKKT